MFNITVNVLHVDSENSVVTTSPYDHASEYEVNIGLVLQYHFVGLDKVPNSVSVPTGNGIHLKGTSYNTVVT